MRQLLTLNRQGKLALRSGDGEETVIELPGIDAESIAATEFDVQRAKAPQGLEVDSETGTAFKAASSSCVGAARP